jgi:hypothetical protein
LFYLAVHAFQVGKQEIGRSFRNIVKFFAINIAFGILTAAFEMNLAKVLTAGILVYLTFIVAGVLSVSKSLKRLVKDLINANIKGNDAAGYEAAIEIVKRFPERIRRNVITGGDTSSDEQLAISLNQSASVAVRYLTPDDTLEKVSAKFISLFFRDS